MKKYNVILYVLLAIIMTAMANVPSYSQTQAQSYSLSLDSCKAMAIRHNNNLKEAEFKIEAAKQVKKSTFTKYFPTVNANFTAMKSADYLISMDVPQMNLPVYDGNPANIKTATEFAYFPGMNMELLDYTNAGTIRATLPIYAGGRIRNGNKLAQLGVDINKDNYQLSKEQVELKTNNVYLTIVSLYEKRNTLAKYEKLVDTLMKTVQVSYDAGLIGRENLLKIQLKKNEIESKNLKLENGIELATMSLCQHIGLPYDADIKLADNLNNIQEPAKYHTDPANAVQNRYEYRMLQKVVDVRELEKKMSVGEALPSVAIGGAGMYLDFMDYQQWNAVGFLTIDVPITKWWSEGYTAKEKEANIAIAELQLKEATEMLQLQITKYYKDMDEAFKQIEVATKMLEQSEQHLKMTTDNYDAGILSVSDMLEAQAIYQEALDAQSSAKCDYMINVQNYLQATARQ